MDIMNVPDGMVRMRNRWMYLNVYNCDIASYVINGWHIITTEEFRLMIAEEVRPIAMERGLVDVEIVQKGDNIIASSDQVQVRTTLGHVVWVPERDIIARRPTPKAVEAIRQMSLGD